MHPSHPSDFDFLQGEWHVSHRRLRERLCDSDAWEAFDGTCSLRTILGGQGNIDDNLLHLPGGDYRAASLRVFDPQTRQWSIWWLDARRPHALDVPVVGGFEHGTGSFFADDSCHGQPVRVRFRWTDTRTAAPRWEQAFSADGGQRWEVNWTMVFTRAAAPPR
jgi:hypothetical protein